MTNHPVHIIDQNDQYSPTALVPFCDFGGDMSALGVKIDQFNVPVCNVFQAKIINDQLCYQVDLEKYKHKFDLKGELSISLYIDYNEERMFEEMDLEEHFITMDSIV